MYQDIGYWHLLSHHQKLIEWVARKHLEMLNETRDLSEYPDPIYNLDNIEILELDFDSDNNVITFEVNKEKIEVSLNSIYF